MIPLLSWAVRVHNNALYKSILCFTLPSRPTDLTRGHHLIEQRSKPYSMKPYSFDPPSMLFSARFYWPMSAIGYIFTEGINYNGETY